MLLSSLVSLYISAAITPAATSETHPFSVPSMLEGSIELESELGKGSTFWLDIPITLTKEAYV